MLTRIRIDGGHAELALAGVRYLPDETGAFEVPDEHANELIRLHGGKRDPGIQALELMVQDIEKDLAALQNHVAIRTADLKSARDRLEKYKAEQSRLRAAAEPPKQAQPQQQNNGQRK